ncbi:MAG: Crp/Fnr family transcriptional regulator [Roseiflexaceae bacterium]
MRKDTNSTFDKSAYLSAVDILRDLESTEIEQLGKRAPMQRVATGTIFYSPEQVAEVLFILKEGRVRLYHLSEDGKALTTAILDAGTIFGEMALLGQRLHQSYAEADTPCLLCLMSKDDVKSMLLSDPRIAARIAETLGQRLISAELRLSDFAFKSIPQRLASLLIQLARPPRGRLFRSDAAPEVAYTHEALAEMVGTYRETITKTLNEFRAAGLIELKRSRVIIRDAAGLRAFGQSSSHTLAVGSKEH